MLRAVADEGGLARSTSRSIPTSLVDRDYIKNNHSPDYMNRFRVAGGKLTIDGSPQGFTAWRDRPYYEPVGNYPPGYAGYAAATDERTVEHAIDWAFANNIQILTHANGEGASDMLIAATARGRGASMARPTAAPC